MVNKAKKITLADLEAGNYKMMASRRRPYFDFVETFGRQFQFPKKFCGERVWRHRCHYRAVTSALSDPTCTYVEGVRHAWVIDAKGHVVEGTWLPKRQATMKGTYTYIGVPYRTDWIREQIEWYGGIQVRGYPFPGLEVLTFNLKGWRATARGIDRECQFGTAKKTSAKMRGRFYDLITHYIGPINNARTWDLPWDSIKYE